MKLMLYFQIALFMLFLGCYDKTAVVKKYITEQVVTYGIENVYRTESYVTIDYRYDIFNDHWGFYPTEHQRQILDHIEYFRYINNIDYKVITQGYDSKKNIYSKEKDEYFVKKNDYEDLRNEQFIEDAILMINDLNNERIQITKEEYEKNAK